MRKDIYTLPELQFVAGQSNTFRWRLWTQSKAAFNADGCTGNFAILDFSDQNADEPVLSKPLTFEIGDESGAKNVARLDLSPSDTVDLHGYYIYQITIVDVDDEAEIPGQGRVHIAHNINSGFLKS